MTNETIKAKAIAIAQQAGPEPISYEEISKFAYGREATANEVAYVASVLREVNLPAQVTTRPVGWESPRHHPSEGPHPQDNVGDFPYWRIEREDGEAEAGMYHMASDAFRSASDYWMQNEEMVNIWKITSEGSLDYTLYDDEAKQHQLFECVECGFHTDEDGVAYNESDENVCLDCDVEPNQEGQDNE